MHDDEAGDDEEHVDPRRPGQPRRRDEGKSRPGGEARDLELRVAGSDHQGGERPQGLDQRQGSGACHEGSITSLFRARTVRGVEVRHTGAGCLPARGGP